ncbi:hypothetical protein KCP78_09405 [Salmonella enterica subsp. enterica]|nr:hypothetical protein KCP78_09405 [Salmonella enterica subsp. enterica]
MKREALSFPSAFDAHAPAEPAHYGGGRSGESHQHEVVSDEAAARYYQKAARATVR